jgi:hypothetical protein
MKRKPFQSWRVLAQSGSHRFAVDSEEQHPAGGAYPIFCLPEFDEVVIREPFVHLERMDTRSLYVGLGDVKLNVSVDGKGRTKIVLYEGELDPKTGIISVSAQPTPKKKRGRP